MNTRTKSLGRQALTSIRQHLNKPATHAENAEVTPPPRFDYIEYGFVGTVLNVVVERRRKTTQMTALILKGRENNATLRIDAKPGKRIAVQVEAGEIVGGVDGEIVDLYVEIGPTAAVAPTAAPRLVRLGAAPRTVRGASAPADGSDVLLRIGQTINGNVSVRTDGGHSADVKVSLAARTVDAAAERFLFRVTAQNFALNAAQLNVTGRLSQSVFDRTLELVFDEEASQASGNWVYDLEIVLPYDEILSSMGPAEETIDLSYELTTEDGRSLRKGFYPRARRFGELRDVDIEVHGEHVRLVPYTTFRSRRMAWRVERQDISTYRLMRRLTTFAWLLAPVRGFLQIWLVGEVPYKAQDNGLRFFDYAASQRGRRRTYYVIRADAADRAKVEVLGPVVLWGSRKHVWLSVLASRLIGSHHSEYLLASRDPAFVRRCRGVRIFLQHGVTATKNVVPNYGRLKSVERPTDKFLVVSDDERRIVMEDYGYKSRQVAVTGFARFDRLFDPAPLEKRVLVMPTWRDTLTREDVFLESAYFQNWRAVLEGAGELKTLRAQGYEVVFMLHPNMRPFLRHFDLTNVTVLDLTRHDVQDELKKSAVLITDYSSVAWDFAFLSRPVLYFHFDTHRLTGARAPHVDFERDLPGPRCTTAAELLGELERTVRVGAHMAENYRARAGRFIEYRDQSNCERIFRVARRPGTIGVIFERWRESGFSQAWWQNFRTGAHYYRWMIRLQRLASRLPGQRGFLFECDRGTHFADSPRAIFEELGHRGYAERIVWVDDTTRHYFDPHVAKIRRNTPRYFWMLGRSKILVTNQNFRDGVRPGKRQTYVQTWHGTPLKRMQFDVPHMEGRADDYVEVARRQTGAWSVLLSPSPYATQCFRSAFGYEGDILEVGYPRNDVLVKGDRAAIRRYVRRSLGIKDADTRKIVLYAPTFRDDKRNGRHWRHDLGLDVGVLRERLGDDAILVLRMHPLVRLGRLDDESGFCVDASKYPDVQELLVAADVLVTDYSSLFFDFAVLRRPMVFYAYDLDHYEDELRGFYLPYVESVPGPVVSTHDLLVSTIASALSERIDADREGFLDRFAPYEDGRASERIVDRLLAR